MLGEQMVLDLVIQAAIDQVDEPVAVDVARGDHLFAQESAGRMGRAGQRHPLVVGSENRRHVQTGQRVVDEGERECSVQSERDHQDRAVQRVVSEE